MEADMPSNKATKDLEERVLSTKQLISICVAQLNEAIQITMPYTLAVYMVRDFQSQQNGGVVDEKLVGKNTGLLAACFCAAQFVSSFPLGRISDKVGRKPMLVMSNASSCISVILFGLSGSFTTAAVFRLLGGLFNCTFVCLKSMIGESCSISAQARPMSILSLCWGLGTVIGPTLGGALSRPCETFGSHFPFCRHQQILHDRPFFLPCFIVGLVSFTAALCSIFYVEETLPALVVKRYQPLSDSEEVTKQQVSHLPELELSRLAAADPLATNQLRDADVEENQPLVAADAQSSDGIDAPSLIPVGSQTGERRVGPSEDSTYHSRQQSPCRQEEWEATSQSKLLNQLTKIEAEKEIAIVWYKDRQTLLVISGYVMICLLYNLLDEMTPIYASADRASGGLEFSTTQLSVPIVAGGVSIFIWNLFFYTWYSKRLGAKNACRLALLLSIPLAMMIGVPSFFSWGAAGLEASLAGVLFFKNICATNSFTSAVMMVNIVAPQKDLGSVNGASQGAASLVRAIGPALGGYIWSLSITLGMQMLGFIITGLGFIIPFLIFGLIRTPQVEAVK